MKIAIISDIHGNLEALKTVIKDIESKNINKIFCLGDIIAKGSHPKECIKLIREKCEVVLQGNCDLYYASDIDLSNGSSTDIDRYNWNRSMLDDESIKYLLDLPYCYEFYMSGRLIRLVHAHPERIDKFAGNIDLLNHIYELTLPSDNTISDEKADVLVYGHIHTPYVQKIFNRYIINAGSVGNSVDVFRNKEKDGNTNNTTVANYLILYGNLNSRNFDDSFSFEIVSIPYDIEKEISNSKDNIELDYYSEELRNGKYRDMEKIYKSFASRGIDVKDI